MPNGIVKQFIDATVDPFTNFGRTTANALGYLGGKLGEAYDEFAPKPAKEIVDYFQNSPDPIPNQLTPQLGPAAYLDDAAKMAMVLTPKTIEKFQKAFKNNIPNWMKGGKYFEKTESLPEASRKNLAFLQTRYPQFIERAMDFITGVHPHHSTTAYWYDPAENFITESLKDKSSTIAKTGGLLHEFRHVYQHIPNTKYPRKWNELPVNSHKTELIKELLNQAPNADPARKILLKMYQELPEEVDAYKASDLGETARRLHLMLLSGAIK